MEDRFNTSIYERLYNDDPQTLTLLIWYKNWLIAKEVISAFSRAFSHIVRTINEAVQVLDKAIRKLKEAE